VLVCVYACVCARVCLFCWLGCPARVFSSTLDSSTPPPLPHFCPNMFDTIAFCLHSVCILLCFLSTCSHKHAPHPPPPHTYVHVPSSHTSTPTLTSILPSPTLTAPHAYTHTHTQMQTHPPTNLYMHTNFNTVPPRAATYPPTYLHTRAHTHTHTHTQPSHRAT
jgi:hypothetical protein